MVLANVCLWIAVINWVLQMLRVNQLPELLLTKVWKYLDTHLNVYMPQADLTGQGATDLSSLSFQLLCPSALDHGAM